MLVLLRRVSASLLFGGLLAFSTPLMLDQVAYASSGGGEEDVAEEGPFYLEMKPVSVPIRRKSGAIKYHMFIVPSLEFDEKDKKSKAKKLTPRLRDAFLQDMSGRSVLHKDKSQGLDFEQIKRRLNGQAKKVLGKSAPEAIHVVKVFKGM